ncbi:MAG: SLBB domain-containing protein [Armatimonadota bacterium]|nr:SLBB domain-containing protein [Armatimonadota bacterium]
MRTRARRQATAATVIAVLLAVVPALAQTELQGYRISPGDVLDVMVYGEEGLSRSYRVGPEGTTAMPILGNVPVGGLTLDEAEELVGTELRRLIKRPLVTVALNGPESHRKVHVAGEVEHPGPMTLPFGATVADAITGAGVRASADLRQVKVTNGNREPRLLDLSGLRGEQPIPAFEPVYYGDVIYVPRIEDRVTVLGEVQQPGQTIIPLGERITVLDAIGRLAGGLTETADRGAAMVLRAQEQPISVDLRALMQEGDLTQNVELQGGDVLVVREAGEVSVLGEVEAPTSFELVEPMTVLDALVRAGGVTEDAGLTRAQVITAEGTIPIDLEGLLERGEMEYDLTLSTGDVVLVPPAEPETVLVLGAVERPGVIDIREQQERDLLRLLTMSVPTENADLRNTYIYREDGRVTADMYAAIHEGDLSENIPLQPDDIVMVPELQHVYLMGAATRTGPIPLTEEMTLLDVVSRFGNFAAGQMRSVTVLRAGPDGETQFIKRNMAAVHREVEPEDLELQDGDVIFIPVQERGVGWNEIRTALWSIGSFFTLLDRF